MNKDELTNKDKVTNEDNSEIINKLYSNNDISEKHNSKIEYSEINKLKDDDESESKKFIKEMHELADKNESKNNVIVLGLGLVIASIIVFSIFMNTSFMKPKTDVAANEPVKKVTNEPVKKVTNEPVKKTTVDSSPTKNATLKPIETSDKIDKYLSVAANRTSVLKKSVALNKGSRKALTTALLSEILRSNSIAIPKTTSSINQLKTDLIAMGWKKNTDFTKLKKGDICFTIDMPEKPGAPSHAFIFMSWVKNGKTDYANICDGQVEEFNNILHKRNLSVSTPQKDKFSFFLRK